MTIKAILFDHDGTLVDSEIAHFQMWVEVLKEYGVSLSSSSTKVTMRESQHLPML